MRSLPQYSFFIKLLSFLPQVLLTKQSLFHRVKQKLESRTALLKGNHQSIADSLWLQTEITNKNRIPKTSNTLIMHQLNNIDRLQNLQPNRLISILRSAAHITNSAEVAKDGWRWDSCFLHNRISFMGPTQDCQRVIISNVNAEDFACPTRVY